MASSGQREEIRTIAFPAISCGVYGYPLAEAAKIALEAVRDHAAELEEVRFVLFTDQTMHHWRKASPRLFPVV